MQRRGVKNDFILKSSLVLLTGMVILAGCRNKNSVSIRGSVKERPASYIYVSKIDIDRPVLIDSAKINRSNKFRIRFKASEPDFYQVGFSNTDYVTLLSTPGEKVILDFPGKNLYELYSVSGSSGSELVRQLDTRLMKTKTTLDSLSVLYNQWQKEKGTEARKQELEQEYSRVIKEQRKFNIAFIITHVSSLASIKALYQRLNDQTYVLYEPRDLQYLKIVSDSLKKHHPESKHTKALIINFEKEMNQFNARQIAQITSKLPETKLDPDCKDLSGRRIVLSSLKGRYVLLTFWSAESKDCITENLQLKEYYNLYRNKGFEIYQINLDPDENLWREAVRYDALPWINTREDNPADPRFARLFNVRTVPANFLFAPDGNIIATNLHGRNLQIKLNQLFTR